MTRRLKNIARRMCDSESFFSQQSPRMTKDEEAELWGSGTSGGLIYYPLWKEKFRAQAIQDGIINE